MLKQRYAIHRKWQELQEELREDKLNSLMIKHLDVDSQDILEEYANNPFENYQNVFEFPLQCRFGGKKIVLYYRWK